MNEVFIQGQYLLYIYITFLDIFLEVAIELM